MYTLYETPPGFDALAAELKQIIQDLSGRFNSATQTLHIPAHEDLSTPAYRKGKLHIIKEGMLACSRGGSNLFYFDEGDMLGLDLQLVPIESCKIWSEMAVVVDELSIEYVMREISGDWALLQQWNQMLACQMSLYLLCLASLAKSRTDQHPDVKHVPAGQVMIEQGTHASEVCTLIEGAAEVMVDGVKVGEVLPGETFGAVAALTQNPRNATVVAAQDSVVMSMKPDQVCHLIETRPHTAVKLIQDMARVIADLNQQLVAIHQ